MQQSHPQTITLDSCVIIDLLTKPGIADKIRRQMKGKSVRIVLCDIIVSEVRRVLGKNSQNWIPKLSKLLGRPVVVLQIQNDEKSDAKQISNQYKICHNGDNFILAFCKAKNFILLTFDRMLLKTCEFLGVVAFHPFRAGGI